MEKLIIAGREFNSRLFLGTGKFNNNALMAEAMEMGASACLVNTAIAVAGNPVEMATAFKEAVVCGRRAYEAGLGAISDCAEASSPLTAFLNK